MFYWIIPSATQACIAFILSYNHKEWDPSTRKMNVLFQQKLFRTHVTAQIPVQPVYQEMKIFNVHLQWPTCKKSWSNGCL